MARSFTIAERGTETATIADAASLSAAVDLGKASLVGIVTPSGWTTAAITFQASFDGVTWFNLYNAAGIEVSVASIAASLWVALDPADFAGVPSLKVRSGTAGTPVNQSGGDAVTLVMRSL